MDETQSASVIQLIGAGAFGVVIGWYIYYVNRYRKAEVQLSDLTTLVGAIGGGAILAIFKAGTDLFGAYGVGLAVGFFGYFVALLVMVKKSSNFHVDWFLDGRRKILGKDEWIPPDTKPTETPMDAKKNLENSAGNNH